MLPNCHPTGEPFCFVRTLLDVLIFSALLLDDLKRLQTDVKIYKSLYCM